jgi:integrase
MERKRKVGLFKRGQVWHVEKQVLGVRLRESTGTASIKEAERYLAHRIEQIRQTKIYGVRTPRLFREAGEKFLRENQHKRSIAQDEFSLRMLDGFIGDLALDRIHMGVLQPYIDQRRARGVKNRTVNHGLQMVRRILNLAMSEWMDEHGLTWLAAAPKIKLLPTDDARAPYPLSWDEQERLFAALPTHLVAMAIFAVNTGCRDHEVCSLRWAWEKEVLALNTSVFIVPGKEVKNGDDRLVVLNDIAKGVIEAMRGVHSEYVFTFRGKPIQRMLNSAWKRARKKANVPKARVHDLKHSLGRRLRACGVDFETRQDLLGHRSSRITTHYSDAELSNLLEAANKVCAKKESAPTVRALKVSFSHICPTTGFEVVT